MLRKRQELKLLLELLGPLGTDRCLLLTTRDEEWLLAELTRAGGDWSAVNLAEEEPRSGRRPAADRQAAQVPLPFAAGSFERVILVDPPLSGQGGRSLTRDIVRLLNEDGVVVILAPNAAAASAGRLRRWLGRAADPAEPANGHTREALLSAVADAGLQPVGAGQCTRFLAKCADMVFPFVLKQSAGVGLRLARAVSALDDLNRGGVGQSVAVAALKGRVYAFPRVKLQ